MKTANFTIELLTPCFCAGADQGKAEIRASSIRGQLRWWFRALGGTAADERTIFGGVAGTASASSLIIRVRLEKSAPAWQPPRVDQNSTDSYVWYFASVSGKQAKTPGPGPRWTFAAALPPGTQIKLDLLQRHPLKPALQLQLDFALKAFLQLGAIGLRGTRGLGTFACLEVSFHTSLLADLQSRGFYSEHRTAPLADVNAIAREIGAFVKGTRKECQMKAESPSPFGSSAPRQTSAIYFRPVRSADAQHCTLVIFEAPHARVLGKVSDDPRVVGHRPSRLTKPEPRSRY